MKKILKTIVITFLVLSIVGGLFYVFKDLNIAVLNPQGEVAMKQRDLLVFTTLLSLVVIIPVFVMLIVFSVRYNATNKKKPVYKPDWEGNSTIEIIMWGIPCAIILLLSVITWQSTHELDPYKKLVSDVKPLNIQVVALQWKWLFIYPDQRVASINLLQIPENTPVNFMLTSDAPMNSFWIPSLGGQVYAMSGMSTQLSLIANQKGDFRGSSANISGSGFADMHFIARSSSETDFNTWVQDTKRSGISLDAATYAQLAKPATMNKPVGYSLSENNLYDTILMKYMSHGTSHNDSSAATHMHMEDTE